MKRSLSSYAVARRHFALTQLVVFITGMLHATLSAQADTFTVTNTAPSGAGSLTAAVAAAEANNNAPTRDVIDFNIAGAGPHVIQLTNALATITEPIEIDGFTQPGSSPNTLTNGCDANLQIEIRGTNSLTAFNLLSGSEGSLFRGFALNSAGIGFRLLTVSNVVEGCYIGLDASGLASRANTDAVRLGNNFNRVGGLTPGARCVISGNTGDGVDIAGGASNVVQGCWIGLDRTGTNVLGNAIGIATASGLSDTLIGGDVPGAGNCISGNGTGIILSGTRPRILGNRIGTDPSGTLDMGNLGRGITISTACVDAQIGTSTAPNWIGFNKTDGIGGITGDVSAIQGNEIYQNAIHGISFSNVTGLIGGPGPGEGNRIQSNGTNGIVIASSGSVTVRANVITANGALGIDIDGNGRNLNDLNDADTGPNRRQNYPVITNSVSDASRVTIDGFLNSTSNTVFALDFFASATCDPTGFGEGEVYLGSTNVVTAGNFTNAFSVAFPLAVADGHFITATATDPLGNTSEFSQCLTNISIVATNCIAPPTGIVAWWPGDDNALDIVNGNNGTLAGGATFGTGFVEKAFRLDGTNDYVDVGFFPQLTNSTGITVMAWVNKRDANNPSAGIVGKFNTSPNTDNTFLLYNGEGAFVNKGGFLLQFDDTSFGGTYGATDIPVGQWVHIAATWRSSDGQIVIYKNGIADATTTAGVGRTLMEHNNYTAKIGEWGVVRDQNFKFSGLIDEVAIANRALGAPEILSIYNAGSFGKCKTDAEAPTITCPGNIVTNTAAGQCSRPVSFNATATGTPTPTVTCTPSSGSVFLSGSTLVSCVASNTAGTAACDFNVTVNDLQSPTVNCPANITTNVPAGVTSANVTFLTPSGSDNCAIAQVVCDPSSGSSFSVGTTPVTCTATDTSGNTGQCGFNVTVTQSAASANLGIAKTVNAPTIALGSNVVYSVTVTNAGPDTAESVVVGDALPGLLDFVSASATQGNCTHDDGLVACQLGAMAAGAVAGIQIEAETRGIGTNCNYAVVSSATTDPVSSNNRAGACTAVYRPVTGADLSLTKASIPDSMIVSNTALFEVRVQNLGPEPAEGVQIQDVLPAGLEFVDVTTTRGSCAENLGTIACDLGTLGVQSNVTVQVTVRGVELGEACNEAEATATTEDPLLSNNTDDACVEVREDREKDHDLAVTKIVAPHTVTFTGTKTRIREQVAVTIQNRGPRTETIKNATVLAGLVRLTADSLGSCAAPEIKLTVGGPQVALPLKLEPKQKATVWFDVKFVRECVNDPEQSSAADPGHEDYRWIAVLDHEVIDGKADTNPEDDVCPRYGRPPFERTPNAPTTIREKGCGDNAPDGSARGGDVLTDVVVP